MKYTAFIFDGTGFSDIEVDKADFLGARECRDFFFAKNQVEEKFNLLLENYIDLETELLGISFIKAVQFGISWSEGADVRQLVNRKLSNLLSSCRAYLDQTRRILKHRYGSESEEFESFTEETHSQYDARLGYRLMEGIRNHAQHCDQPISSITFSGRRDVQEGAPRIHSIRMSVRMERLVAAGKVKSEILDEIPEDNGLIHLGPHVRDYVTGLIKVQKKVRDSLSKETARYEGEFERLIGLMPKTDRSRYKSIRWRCTGDDGEIDEEVVLLEDHISRIKELERRNRYSGELSTLIVTSGDTA